jgi:hypothetical protein
MARPVTKTNNGSAPPLTEIGAVLSGNFTPAGMAPWISWVDIEELVPQVRWPNSVRTYQTMRGDSQVAALYEATLLAVQKMEWLLDPNGAPDDMVQKLSTDYNIPIMGQKKDQVKRGRMKNRFSLRNHIRLAFKAGIYGHYYFEQVGYIGDGKNGHPNDGMWHLRKLAERPPLTIAQFRVAEDGGLVSIVQNVMQPKAIGWHAPMPEIPVDRLVAYVWDREGANWAGRSWFREVYKNWVIKDRLLRIDAINHERAGGVPYIVAHPGATNDEIDQLNQMAQGFRVGDTAGGAIPSGAKFEVARGLQSSVIQSVEYHDQAMARKFMLMVMQLGQTRTGSRALGTTFVDFWAAGMEAIAWWFSDIFNAHVIEDDIDWNYGEDEVQIPLLVFDFDPELVVADLVAMISSGAIIVDDDLEAAIRKEMHLPEAEHLRPVPAPLPPSAGVQAPPVPPPGAEPVTEPKSSSSTKPPSSGIPSVKEPGITAPAIQKPGVTSPSKVGAA